jgi:hypothetical protein
MSSFVVDLSNVGADIRNFPDGVYEASIKSAKLDVSKRTANTTLAMEIEIYSPVHGTAVLRDWLSPAFEAKVKHFWVALNDLTEEQVAASPVVELNPPDLVGAQLLVKLGEQENKETGKVYKSLVGPWYYPLSRATDLLLADEEADKPF